ncbi:MAG: hypothetical protein PHY40_03750 [Patescibacteria group bacterium]|nr:hypothetical protein [Patescibacteria group bacterium]
MKTKEELIKEISQFLDDSPFEDLEVKEWKNKMLKMDAADLEELFSLFKERLRIITEANQLFVKMAEEVADEQKKEERNIPKEINLLGLKIEKLSLIFRNNLSQLLYNETFDLLKKLDEYFAVGRINKENLLKEFDLLIKALSENKEILLGKSKAGAKISISQWCLLYDIFNGSRMRKNIDRITFVSKDDKANGLNEEEKKVLLKLLKLYDFLLNPSDAEFAVEEKKTEIRSIAKISSGVNSLAKKIDFFPAQSQSDDMKNVLEQYPVGSLERKAIEEEIAKMEQRS